MDPRLAQLGYFVGTWNADVRDPTSGKTFTLAYSVQPDLGGAWLVGRGTSPAGLEVRDHWGIDGETGEVVRVVFDSQGTWGVVKSRGWEGDTLRLEGEARARGAVLRVRETLSREGPNRFRAVWEAFQDGAWVAYSVETLERER